jgi:hypothetical protein
MYLLTTSSINNNHFDILKNKISNNNTPEPSSSSNHTTTSFDISKNEISITQSSTSIDIVYYPSVLAIGNDTGLSFDISNNKISSIDLSNTYTYSYPSSKSSVFIDYTGLSSIYVFNYPSNCTYLYSSSFLSSSLSNDLYNTSIDKNTIIPVNTIDTEEIDVQISTIYHDTLPLFFKHDYLLKIPRVERFIRRNIPKQILLSIHSDYNTAVELCLLYVSQMTSTYFDVKSDSTSHGWKFLKAEYLQQLVGGDAKMYKRIREALEYKHPIQGQLLECDHKHIAGFKSFGHRIQRQVLLKGVVAYKLKSDYVRKQWYHNQLLSYARAERNPIARNLILMYPYVELPTLVEVKKEAKRLVKAGYVTKKGKLLTFLNKHPKTYFKNHEQRSFVEDAIEIYTYLTQQSGFIIPNPSEESAGGRVYDSLNLMPTWIRNLVKYKGEPLVELDYTCLHPNIACSLYGGNSEYLKHIDLVEELGLSVDAVKKEHLSFFNKKVVQMKQSPLFEYYNNLEPCMMQNIIHDKIYNTEYIHKSDKHKITSKRMFTMEVQIMTSVIEKLNHKGIHVAYVFDALYSHPNDVSVVIDTMNKTVLEYGVKTNVKH